MYIHAPGLEIVGQDPTELAVDAAGSCVNSLFFAYNVLFLLSPFIWENALRCQRAVNPTSQKEKKTSHTD